MYCGFAGSSFLSTSFSVRGAVNRSTVGAKSSRVPARSRAIQMAAANPRARVVPSPLPRVYVYDHCPFACRVRYVLGMKNVKHDLVWFLNDDIDTPTGLVGKKIVPIFELGRKGEPNHFVMMESMDICMKVDSEEAYGPTGLFGPKSGRTDLTEWLNETSDVMRRLTRPRNVLAPLPEFAFEDARQAFIRNHPLKEEPKDYNVNFENSPALIEKMNTFMLKMEEMIFSAEHVSEGGLCVDDIEIFPRLRGLTIIEGLEIQPKTKAYIDYMSKTADIPNYYAVAQ